MNTISPIARIYIFFTILGGAIVLGYSVLTFPWKAISWADVVLFTFLAGLAELRPIRVSSQYSITLGIAFYFAMLILFGAQVTVWAVMLISVLVDIFSRIRWYKILFNSAQTAIAFYISGAIYQYLAGTGSGFFSFGQLTALVSSALALFVLNIFFISSVVSLAERTPFTSAWKDQWNWIKYQLLTLPVLGTLLAFLYLQNRFAILLLLLPLILIYYSFQVQSANQELDRKVTELSVLFEASQSLGATLTMEETLGVIVAMANRFIPNDRVNVYLLEKMDFRSYLRLVGTSFRDGKLSSLTWEHEGPLWNWVAWGGQAIIVYDNIGKRWIALAGEQDVDKEYATELYKNQRSALSVPLQLGENQIGVLEITITRPGAYTKEELQLLCTLANLASVSIKNAQLYEETRSLASTDGLTGLYNHRLFQELLYKEISKAHREVEQPVSLILADVDYFKKFNDQFGHQVGDQVLKLVAQLFKQNIREGDIAARYGGEEFAVILPLTTKEIAWEVAERLRKAVESHSFEIPGRGVQRISISLGVSSFPKEAHAKDPLIQRADAALYFAKESGRNRVSLYSKEMLFKDRLRRRGGTEKVGPHALERIQNGFFLQVSRLVANLIDARDAQHIGHSSRVATYSVKVAQKLRLSMEEIQLIRTAALLHDVGKLGISENILQKRGPLTSSEFDAIKRHPEIGYTLLGQLGVFQQIGTIIYQHQEHYDGTGYPQGLSKDQISLGARIIAVADAFETMVSTRPYRNPFTIHEALIEIQKGSGKQFDPAVVERFIAVIGLELRRTERELPETFEGEASKLVVSDHNEDEPHCGQSDQAQSPTYKSSS
ncbi:MAG: diguanylate cyclase [Armatimonadetes bacterium]|nr:diguanylate cyclase [Armatimonadota bacterium]